MISISAVMLSSSAMSAKLTESLWVATSALLTIQSLVVALSLSKPFDRELYDENDDAKNIVIKWLGANGVEAWVNPDDYGIDLLSSGGKQYEVEVKHNWRGENFPFTTVHFPKRKLKYANEDSHFFMLNHERTHVLWVWGYQFLQSPVVVKNTIYTQGEEFVEINVEDCTIYKMVEVDE